PVRCCASTAAPSCPPSDPRARPALTARHGSGIDPFGPVRSCPPRRPRGAMQFGVTMFSTDQAMRPDDLARAAEERGFASMYVPEHTHIPTSQRTPPPTGDAELPDYYKRAFDPFVGLTMAAAATERLRVGTGICLVAQRDPIVTAKSVA